MNQDEIINAPTETIDSVNLDAISTDALALLDSDFRYGFRLGDLGFLLPKLMPTQVVAKPKVFPIPNTVYWMKGLASVLGSLAAVIDLAELFELNLDSQQDSIVVLTILDELVAFPFDSAHSLELPPSAAIDDLDLPESIRAFSGKNYQTDLGTWFEFDFQSCLSQFSSKIRQ